MPYVVTQACCADASCVVACPVNCIHPAPGEPGFATAEMLYVDGTTCVDCGACASACPVAAIKPHTTLSAAEQPFVAINAAYYDCFPHADRAPLAPVPEQRRLRRRGPFRVAVVGAGPAGLYTADELLKHPEVSVDVLDRLPTPYGLVRAGVAPDHPHTKRVERLFAAIEDAEETVASLLDDLDAAPGPAVSHAPTVAADELDLADWRALDREERRRGARRGAPRDKVVDVTEAVAVAVAARPRPAPRSRVRLSRGSGRQG